MSRGARLVLAVLAIAAPPALASLLHPGFVASPWFFGMWLTLYLALTSWSSRSIALRAVMAAALGGVCVLLHGFPLLGGLFIALATAYAGWSTRQGIDNVMRFIPVVLCFLIVNPPQQFPAQGALVNAAWSTLLMAAASLWLMATAVPLLRPEIPALDREKADVTTAAILAVVMGVVVGACTVAVLFWWPSFDGAWLMLTVLVMVQANTADTISLSRDRILGTLLGILVALALSPVEHLAVLSMLLGTLFFLASLWVLNVAHRPYWQFVALLTPAVVILDSPGRDVARVALDRLAFTLVGIAVAIPTVLLIHWLVRRADAGLEPS